MVLEDRTLLASDVPAFVPLGLGTPQTGTLAPLGAAYYQVAPQQPGLLTATVDAAGFPARLALVNADGQPLVQSDGSPAEPARIDEHVPAETEYLEVQSLGSGGTFTLEADLTPSVGPSQTIPMPSGDSAAPLALVNFAGEGRPALVAPDGVHPGLPDGTFQATAVGGQITAPNETAGAIAVGAFQDGGPQEIAVAETNQYVAGDVRILSFAGNQFQVVSTFPVGPDPIAIQTVSLENGGLALAVADGETGAVTLYRDDGDGNFTLWQTLNTSVGGGAGPYALASGRATDGPVDLFIADIGDLGTGQAQEILVYQETASGQFQLAQAPIALATGPAAMVADDFGNGELDLAVVGNTADVVSVYLGAAGGDGTLNPVGANYAVGADPDALIAADFNGDGHLDLATANSASDDVSVLLGNGDGTFQPQIRSGAGNGPVALVAGDFNGDGRTDLAVGEDYSNNAIAVLLGNGNGTFQDEIQNDVDAGPVVIATADLNNDGQSDLITANEYANDVSVLMGHGDGTFNAPVDYAVGDDPSGIAVGDFNDDGNLDLAVSYAAGSVATPDGGVSLLFGNGDGTFQGPFNLDISLPPSSDVPTGETVATFSPTAIVAGDFTGDGDLDLAVVAQTTAVNEAEPWIVSFIDTVTVLLGNGHGAFSPMPPILLGNSVSDPVAIVAGDFTGDSHLDLAVADQTTSPDGSTTDGTVTILQGDGQGGFQVTQTLDLGAGPYSVPVAMTLVGPGNGPANLAVACNNADDGAAGTVTILQNNGQGGFTPEPPITLPSSEEPSSITAGALGSAGTTGLAVTATNGGTDIDSYQLYLFDAEGNPLPVPSIALGAGGLPTAVVATDLTGSGKADLAIARYGPDDVDVLLNQGNGQFVAPTTAVLNTQDNPVAADFTGSGLLSVAEVDGSGNILFREAESASPGRFEPPVVVNPGDPSRDITAIATANGTEIASVDADDDFVSLFQYQDGAFHLVSQRLPTGAMPAQIVAADLRDDGRTDLVVRNAGDGTLSVFLSNGAGGFSPPFSYNVGAGVSDLAVADVNRDRLPDLVVTNEPGGTVEVLLNQEGGSFSAPTVYRAGSGASEVTGSDDPALAALTSMDETMGAAVAAPADGGPAAIVTANPGSNTIGILTGLGGGQFANALSVPTPAPVSVVRVGDLNGDGIPDLALLSPAGVTVEMGNGQGGFGPPTTYPAGPDPTGLTITSYNGVPALLVGDSEGDLLTLLRTSSGGFAPPSGVANNVALAAVPSSGPGGSSVALADEALNRLIVRNGPGSTAPATSLGDASSGLLSPSAVVTADLGGNGVPDLIVVNSGGNDVLVYPGEPGGGFGPAMNNGNGFPTGTDPVSVTVADVNGDGRPDLIVANRGSNDVSILLNEPDGDGFTFVPGPRLQAGEGPVGTALVPSPDGGPADLVVSDSVSDDLLVLDGRGNGFFDDANPAVIPLPFSPGSIEPGLGNSVITVNPTADTVALFNNVSSSAPTWTTVSSGGIDPVAALAVAAPDGSEDLVVANYDSGSLALFTIGALGLTLTGIQTPHDLPNPTDVAPDVLTGNTLTVYAATAGVDSASLVTFLLGASGPPPSGSGYVLTLQPSRDSGLPLVASLLVSINEAETAQEVANAAEPGEAANALAPSAGQSLIAKLTQSIGYGNEDEEEVPEEPPPLPDEAELAPWIQSVLGLDHAFEQMRQRLQGKPPADAASSDDASRLRRPEPVDNAPRTAPQAPASSLFETIDAAVAAVAGDRESSAGSLVASDADGRGEPSSLRSVRIGAILGCALLATPRGLPRLIARSWFRDARRARDRPSG